MRNKKIYKKITVIALTVFIIQLGILGYLKISKQINMDKQNDKQANNNIRTNDAISTKGAIKVNMLSNKTIDTSQVVVAPETINLIKNSDINNYDKNLNNYKRVLVEFEVPEEYQNEIFKFIKGGYSIPKIFIAYNFLNQNYGFVKDMNNLLQLNQKGMKWEDIFLQYKSEAKPFIPSNFTLDYLDKLIKQYGLTADDVMIADRISQKGLRKFEDLIKEKKQGKQWKEIKLDLGIVNLSEKFPRVTLTSEDVDKYTGEGLTKEQIIDSLVLAQSLNENSDDIIQKIKAGKSQEDIYAEYFEKKYD